MGLIQWTIIGSVQEILKREKKKGGLGLEYRVLGEGNSRSTNGVNVSG